MIVSADQVNLVNIFKLPETTEEILLAFKQSVYHDLLYLQKGRESQLIFKGGRTLKSSELCGYLCLFKSDLLSIDADSLNPHSFMSLYRYSDELIVNIPPDRVERFDLIFDLIYSLFKSSTEHKAILIASYLLVILKEADIIFKQFYQINHSNKKTSADIITRRFKDLIAKHYLQIQTVKDYAKMLCITPNYLNKIVKTTAGKTALQLIIETILAEAKALLDYSSMNISEIAYTLGFEDSSYFSRLFRKKIGVAPGQYRRM